MFNIDNSVSSQSSSKNQLPGNLIHTVIFKGAESVDLKDGEYKVVQLKFENEQGEFVDTIFEPTPEMGTRKPNDFGGENPSGIEEMTSKVRHLIAAVNPELDKQIEAGTKPLKAANWEGFRKLIVSATQKGIGKETQIKLINSGEKQRPRFPGFTLSISKTGNLYLRTNYIGDNLHFTPKELERINTAAVAKPTNMGGSNAPSMGDISLPDAPAANDLDFDFEDL